MYSSETTIYIRKIRYNKILNFFKLPYPMSYKSKITPGVRHYNVYEMVYICECCSSVL